MKADYPYTGHPLFRYEYPVSAGKAYIRLFSKGLCKADKGEALPYALPV